MPFFFLVRLLLCHQTLGSTPIDGVSFCLSGGTVLFPSSHLNYSNDLCGYFRKACVQSDVWCVTAAVTNIDTVINRGLATAEGLAIDWITRHIYWVESNLDQIEVADFEGKNRLTLIAGDMESPRAVVLDPSVG